MKGGYFAILPLWLVGTAIWMIGWAITIDSNCGPGPGDLLVCRPDFLPRVAAFLASGDVSRMELALWGMIVPLAVLGAILVGAAVLAAIRRNRPKD